MFPPLIHLFLCTIRGIIVDICFSLNSSTPSLTRLLFLSLQEIVADLSHIGLTVDLIDWGQKPFPRLFNYLSLIVLRLSADKVKSVVWPTCIFKKTCTN